MPGPKLGMDPLQFRGSPVWKKIGPPGIAADLTSQEQRQARSFAPNPPKERIENARAIIMDGANFSTGRADAALSGDLLYLVAKDCPLDLFDDPLPIYEAQSEAFGAGNPVRA